MLTDWRTLSSDRPQSVDSTLGLIVPQVPLFGVFWLSLNLDPDQASWLGEVQLEDNDVSSQQF